MNIITDNAQLSKNIKSISKKRVELVALVQATGMGALYQAMKHKNINVANDLCAAVGAGMKQQALILWLCRFGPFNPQPEKQQAEGRFVSFDKTKMPENDADMDARLRAAAEREWHEDKTETNAAKYMSIGNMIHAIIKQYEGGKHQLVASDHDDEALDTLRKLADKMPKVDLKAHAKNASGLTTPDI